jgi:hypothetical protein
MEALCCNLETARRKRASDAEWAAMDAAYFVLGAFRDQVRAGLLGMSEGPDPRYIFDPCVLAPPTEAFKVADWARHHGYVLGLIRRTTGMRVTWEGPGTPIVLDLPRRPCMLAPSCPLLPEGGKGRDCCGRCPCGPEALCARAACETPKGCGAECACPCHVSCVPVGACGGSAWVGPRPTPANAGAGCCPLPQQARDSAGPKHAETPPAVGAGACPKTPEACSSAGDLGRAGYARALLAIGTGTCPAGENPQVAGLAALLSALPAHFTESARHGIGLVASLSQEASAHGEASNKPSGAGAKTARPAERPDNVLPASATEKDASPT